MGIVFDLAALAVIVLFGIIGYVKGFVSTFVSLAKWVAALIVASLFAALLASLIYSAFIGPSIESKIAEIVPQGMTESQVAGYDTSEVTSLLKKIGINASADDLPVISSVNELKAKGAEIPHIISETYVKPVYMATIKPICYAVIFIAVVIVGILLEKAGKLTNLIPVVGKLNKTLGVILGILYGAAIVCIVCCAIALIIRISGNSIEWLNTRTFENTGIKYLMGLSAYRP